MGATVAGDDGSIGDQRVVNTRERHQIGLELVQIHVESAVEAQTRRDGADDLGNQAVQVVKAGARNLQVAATDVVNGLIVHQESTVRVLDGAVGGQDGVVRLHNGSGHTRRRVDRELELGLLAVLGGELLQESGTEARASTTTERVEDQEALQGGAVV